MNARDILPYGQLALLGTLDGMPAAGWSTPGACGRWSVKDIIAHLASYELVLVDVIGSLLETGATPHLDRFRQDGPAFNDAEVERRRAWTPDETLAELARAHAQTLALIADVPDEERRRVGTLLWYGTDYALDDLLVYMAYGHKREHAAQIAAARSRTAA